MLFRVNFQIEPQNRNEVAKRFLEIAENPDYALPEGLTVIGAWHCTAALNGTTIWETDDIMLLYNWYGLWTDIMVFEIDPVIEDEDVGTLCMELMRRIQA